MSKSWLKSGLCAALVALQAIPAHSDVTGNDLPDFGDSSGSLISPTQEMELGAEFMRSVRAQATLVTDPDIEGYITQLGDRLVASSDAPSYPFTFFVVDNSAINAFAGPGGYIGIHTGLILAAENESELAGVMAHEIAHVTQRHLLRAYESASQMSLPTAAGMLAAILLGVAGSNPEAGIAAMSAVQGANIQHQLNFTRANEMEADRIGIQTLAHSGIDPYGMPSFFERLQQSTRLYGNNYPDFLLTHPVTTDRIAEAMSRAESFGHSKEIDTLDFRLIRARLRVLQADNPQDALEYFKPLVTKSDAGPAEHYGLALAYWRNNDYAAAKKQLQALMNKDPDRKIYRSTMARLELDSGQTDQALKLYQDTLKLYPGDLVVGQYYTSALIQAGQAAEAREQALKMLRDKHARTPEIYELWAKAASVAGPAWETHVASAEAYYLYGNLRFAIDQLNKALQYKGLSDYEQARIEARLKEFKQMLRDIEQKK
jgi:beta-barrel assembly-enhancing protease